MDTHHHVLHDASRLLAPVVHAYNRRYRQYGASPHGVFWKDAEFQRRRYENLITIFDDADHAGGLTIHDFGCGYGAFFDFLKDRPVMYRSRYIGTEISEPLVAAARERIDDQRTYFVRALSATETADYTFASGTFNMHMRADEADWLAYVKASLAQLWERSRKGLAFNMLRHDAPEKFCDLYYADAELFREFCLQEFSTNVRLTNDDPLPDWTIFVQRH